MSREVMQQALDALIDFDYDKRIKAVAALLAALREPEPQREHITDGAQCWCGAELDYKDPVTGAEVWVHKEPQ